MKHGGDGDDHKIEVLNMVMLKVKMMENE